MATYARALTIAGSDSGGGAGIQADLKTFSALGCYGMSAITAITAQNTREVTAVHPVPVEVVVAQIDAVLSDIGADAIKIGMLFSAEIAAAVGDVLSQRGTTPIVLDPVMVAKSGDHLLAEAAVASLKKYVIPLADLLTPNLPEATTLLGREVGARDDMEKAAVELLALGPKAVLLKGGHLDADMSADLLVYEDEGAHLMRRWFEYPRIETSNTHGTGCTLSSAVAAYLARGMRMEPAVERARSYIQKAIESGAGFTLGSGHGPVHHFHALWR